MLNSAYAYAFRFLIACMPASKLGSGEFCPVIFIVMFDCQQSGSSSDLSRQLPAPTLSPTDWCPVLVNSSFDHGLCCVKHFAF